MKYPKIFATGQVVGLYLPFTYRQIEVRIQPTRKISAGEQTIAEFSVALPLSYRDCIPGGNRTRDLRSMKYP